jgi:hypothetical protein
LVEFDYPADTVQAGQAGVTETMFCQACADLRFLT